MSIKKYKKTAQQLFDKTPYEVFFNSDEKFIIEKYKNELNNDQKKQIIISDKQAKKINKKFLFTDWDDEKSFYTNPLQKYMLNTIWKKFFKKRIQIFWYIIWPIWIFTLLLFLISLILTGLYLNNFSLIIFWLVLYIVLVIGVYWISIRITRKYSLSTILFLTFNYYNSIILLE